MLHLLTPSSAAQLSVGLAEILKFGRVGRRRMAGWNECLGPWSLAGCVGGRIFNDCRFTLFVSFRFLFRPS